MIKFSCSKCGKHIRVDDKYAGKRGKCPGCGEAVLVPGKSAAIRFSCAHCGHAIKVPQRYAGKKGKCPKCQQAVVVPGPKQKPVEEPQGPTVSCSLCGAAIPMTDDEFVECPECGSFVYAASGAPADAEATSPDEEEGVEEESDEPARESEGTNRRLLLILGGVAAVVIVGVIGLIVFLKLSQPEPPQRPVAPRRSRQVADTETQEQPEPRTAASTPPSAPAEKSATAAAPAVRLRFAPAPGITRFVQVATERHFTIQGDARQVDLREQETLTFELEAAAPDADGNIPITVTLAAVQVKRDTGGTTVGDYDSTEPPDSTNRYGKMCAPFVSGRLRMVVSAQGQVVGFDMDELYRAVAEILLAARGNAADPRYPSREEHLQALKTQSENSAILGKKQLCSALEALVAALPEQPFRVGDTWSDHITVQVGAPIDMPVTYTLAAADDNTGTIKAEAQRGAEAEPVVLGSDQMTISYALSGISEATLTIDHPTGWLLSKQQKTNLSGQIETRFAKKPDQDTTDQTAAEITVTVTTIPTSSDSTSPGTPGSERPLPATGPGVQLRFAPAAGTKRTMRVTNRLDTSVPAAGQQQNVTGIESVTLDLEATPANADGTVPVKVTLAAIQVKTEMGGIALAEYDSANVQGSAEAVRGMYDPFVGGDFMMTVSARGEIIDFGLDELFRAAAEQRVEAEDSEIRGDSRFAGRAEQVITRMDERLGSRENRVLAMKKQLEEFPALGKDKICGLLSELLVFLPEKPLRDGDHWSYPIAIAQVDRRLRMPTLHTLTAVEDSTCTIHSEGERALEEEPFVQESGTLRLTHKLGGSSSATVTVDRGTGWLLSKEQKTNLSGQIETVGSGQPDQDTTVEVSLEITTTITALE